MHVDVGPPDGAAAGGPRWAGVALAVRAGARDLAPAGVSDEVSLSALFDGAGALVEVDTSPLAPWTGGLLGQRPGSGFRRGLDAVVPADEAGGLLRQVIDDLPAAALISGYAWMRLARRAGKAPGSLVPPSVLEHMTDLCSGWRAGGIAVASIGEGRGVPVQDCPPAPELLGADPLAWHTMAPLPDGWTRRRRCIDVRLDHDGGAELWAMFRDTVGEGGGELVLHEYTVSLSVVDGVVIAVGATPRVLPFPECPAAAAAVADLVGSRLAALPSLVPSSLTGIRSCTHLNDLLRSVGGAAGLVEVAAGA